MVHPTTSRSNPIMSMAFLVGLLMLCLCSSAQAKELNVFDLELEPCSTSGMALAGISDTGQCIQEVEEGGKPSTTICVDIPSFAAAYQQHLLQQKEKDEEEKRNRKHLFLGGLFSPSSSASTSTKKESLMLDTYFHHDESDMPCTENATQSNCPIQNWCITQDNFAQYVEYMGGCEHVGKIVCGGTHQEALALYEQEIFDGMDYEKNRDALECLKFKCWL